MHSVKFLSWIRKPESLIMYEKTEKSYSYIRNTKSLIRYMEDYNVCPISAQCLPNVCPMFAQCLPNVCPMFAQCLTNVCSMSAQRLPTVCTMSPICAQCLICLPNVPKFCPMLFAVKSRISSDMFWFTIEWKCSILILKLKGYLVSFRTTEIVTSR